MRQRVTTGVSILDKMLNNGIPEGNQVALAGSPGVGKTLTAFEFLYKNAKAGNRSILFSLEEDPDQIVENARDAFTDFKDIDALIGNGMLSVEGADIKDTIRGGGRGQDGEMNYVFSSATGQIAQSIKAHGATRIVIDSLTTFKLLVNDSLIYRMLSLNLLSLLKNLKVTSILTLEVQTLSRESLKYQPEFFIYDGIIALYSTPEERNRIHSLEVLKMRGTKHSFKTVPYVISNNGITPLISVDNVL
jgi:circadian clock protein KaiC